MNVPRNVHVIRGNGRWNFFEKLSKRRLLRSIVPRNNTLYAKFIATLTSLAFILRVERNAYLKLARLSVPTRLL